MNNPSDIVAIFKHGTKEDAIDAINAYREKMNSVELAHDYINWMAGPVNLTAMHAALIEHHNVPPRAMAIRRQPMSRTKRVAMLLLAMENGLKR